MPAGNRLSLRIADITIALHAADPLLIPETTGSRARFLSRNGEPHLTLHASWKDLSRLPLFPQAFDAGPLWQLHRDGDRLLFVFRSALDDLRPYKLAVLNSLLIRGQVFLDRSLLRPGQEPDPLEYPLDELLMVSLLSQERGVEVHGFGVRDSMGDGLLFVGQSGAGKTTMARLWADGEDAVILSDDRIVLRRTGDGISMYGTPWHGEAMYADPGSAPLRGIFLLRHGTDNRLTSLRPAQATARLFACSFVPFYNPEGLAFALDFLENLVRDVPCHELRFVPDRRIVDVVRGWSSQG
jgi:hypothetical protein